MMKTLSLLLCIAPALISATEIPEKGWEYERLDDDHVMIHNADQSRHEAAIDPDTEGDVTIPSSLRNKLVVSIGEKAFYNCSKLTSVTISEGVTNIAENAFWGCTSLTNVVFPASLKSIGKDAFYKCTSLASAVMAGATVTIGNQAFMGCSSLRMFVFSGDSLAFGEATFAGCKNLLDVDLDAKVVVVGKGAFAEKNYQYTSPYYDSFSACTGLADVSAAVTSLQVGELAFAACSSLERLDVASSNLTVGASAFSNCSSLSNAVLVGEESAFVGESAFSSCSKLRKVELPVALMTVATNVFYKCTSLTEISIPSNVTRISYRAFDTCTSLREIDFSEGLKTIDAQAFYGCESIESLDFPQSLESVGARAFEWCDGLTDIVFAEGDTNHVAAKRVSIGERAFYNCLALQEVLLPQNLTAMGSRAFSQCDSLERINIPSNFTDIAESVFEDCATLSSIDFPDALKSIGNTAFFGCTNLTDFLIPTQNVVSLGAKAFKNTKYWNDYPSDLVVNNGYILGFKNNPVDVVLPDGCKSIPVAMFEGMTTLKSVTIPDSVTEIGSRAFNGCSGITNLVVTNVTVIGNSAFEGCSSLTTVALSKDLTAIPGNCFKDCTSLAEFFIPDSVASIGEYAFYNCASLVNVSGGAGVTRVGDYAFAQCPKMQPFEFPKDVAYGDHVFQGCTWTEHVLFPTVGTLKDEYPATYMNITSVVFSSSMTTITNGACAGCSSLAYVRIPDGVISIGGLAFDGCTSLTSVVMSASVSNVVAGAFTNCPSIVFATVNGLCSMQYLFPQSYANLLQVGFTDGVTSLCSNFMAGCRSVSTVAIPTNLTSIAAYAFQGCSGIASLLLPSCLETIPEGMCSGCTALGAIDFPDGVTSIGSLAFDGCTSFRSATMSASVTSVASDAFKGCTALVSLVVSGQFALSAAFPDTYANWTEVGIASDATSLCDELFKGCTSLAAIEIPWRVTEIGARAFYGCSALTNVVVPEYVTTIGDCAFGGCTSLRSVDYLCEKPESVSTNIYMGTRGDMMSKVLVQHESWQTATNCAGATILPSEWCEHQIVWWGTVQSRLATIYFAYNTPWGGGEKLYFLADAGRKILTLPKLPDHPFNTNLVCTGWYTASSGGVKVEEGIAVGGSATYYAHWVVDGEEEPEPEDDEDGKDNAPEIWLALPEELATGEEITDASVDVSDGGSSPTLKVTGLPTGLKFTAKDIYEKGSKTEIAHAANTIYGTPTKSGVYTVVATVTTAGKQTASCSQTVVVRKEGESVVLPVVVLMDAEGAIADSEAVPGKVTGGGVYAPNKKVTLRATANKGYVFAGWYDEFSSLVSSLATYSFTMGEDDVTLMAAFVTTADDQAGIDATVNGMSFPYSDDDIPVPEAIETNAYVGAYVEWPVEASALSATTVKVTGLPAGLKFAATPVVKKTTTGTGANRKTTVVTNVPANTIYGTPTTASKADRYGAVQPSKIVITVTTAGRNVRKFTVNFTVLALPAACVGTFSGYAIARVNTNAVPAAADETGWISLVCPFTATVNAKGALSGSLTALGKKLAFSATGYSSFDAETANLNYDVVISPKTIDKTWTENLSLALSIASGAATLASPTTSSSHLAVTEIEAWRNAAKDTGFAGRAKPYAGTYIAAFDVPMPDGVTTGLVTVALTVDQKGGVKAAGTFVDATTFSASSTLALAADDASAEVLLPVTGKAFGSGGLLLAFRFEKGDDGFIAVAPLADELGRPVSCAAKYVQKTARTSASYAAYAILGKAAYAYSPDCWIGEALTKNDLLSVSYLDGETPYTACYLFTSRGTAVTGVGRTANGAKLSIRVNSKTGLFTGANGKTKVFGALYPADAGDSTVSGCGSAVFATGIVSPLAIGVADNP